ncbi:MAG TPA: serine/threonine-protein kinase [Candidatus Limnocylindria bacterium]|nr:serine/threonine-protein kinase [Candidatus Limnocylindria bacterium]
MLEGDLAAGASIDDDLVVVERLGGGRRYEVYRATDRRTGGDVAVKVLRPALVADRSARDAFAREVTIATGLAHPHLARLIRWNEDAPPRSIWELVADPSLDVLLDVIGPLPTLDVCRIGVHIADALAYLRDNDILHLDVTPANVATGAGTHLLDLSLARRGANGLELRHSVGTGPYMSPEQCRAGRVDKRSDVFGLGATLYEALSAIPPFGEGVAEDADLIARYPQLSIPPQPLADLVATVPRALSALIESCLAADPNSRPSSAREVEAALRRVSADLGRELPPS